MAQITCIVVTPERTALEETADFVALPLFDGELGIASNHSPMIGRLGYGELRLKTGATVRRFYVDGGFVQVADNVVSVLTNRAIPADRINLEAARTQLTEAGQQVATTDEQLEIRERLIWQARAQIRVGERAS
ncbi:MAG: ATP synthase F1 subunit epsilon [Pirellulaceae bacterium]|nr:ATP synthase F1 subunit epsilon [Planctomycetales bacterium]MCA9223624.1 ATP synthase F1 subunit epsilon [Planctomycetales bacterium]